MILDSTEFLVCKELTITGTFVPVWFTGGLQGLLEALLLNDSWLSGPDA